MIRLFIAAVASAVISSSIIAYLVERMCNRYISALLKMSETESGLLKECFRFMVENCKGNAPEPAQSEPEAGEGEHTLPAGQKLTPCEVL
jgi:hypothetical protein